MRSSPLSARGVGDNGCRQHLLADRAWQLRANATTYDAGYVTLAELTGDTLVTCDARLGNIPGATVRGEVFA